MIHVRIAQPSLEVEFQAAAGITALFGPSGAGKTAILDAIAGFLTPPGGRIILDDEILFDAASRVNLPPRRRHCGYVAREWSLFPHMSLRDNLLFPLAGLARLERHRRVTESLDRFALKDAAARCPHEVSPAERLRCTFARALIGEPKLLLVDEPVAGFDAELRAEWLRVSRMIRDESNLPVLLATRDLDICFEVGTKMLVLVRGRILQTGAPRDVLDQPASVEVARLLGIANLLPAQITALDPSRNTSRLSLENFELNGPYFPGHLRGDRVWLCAQASDLRAAAANGTKPQANQAAVRLECVSEMAHAVRLEFAGGIAAEIPPQDFERQRDNKDWLIEFPAQALRVITRDATEEL